MQHASKFIVSIYSLMDVYYQHSLFIEIFPGISAFFNNVICYIISIIALPVAIDFPSQVRLSRKDEHAFDNYYFSIKNRKG